MSTCKHKNSLRTIEAQIVQKLKNNEARPKFTGSYEKKRVIHCLEISGNKNNFRTIWGWNRQEIKNSPAGRKLLVLIKKKRILLVVMSSDTRRALNFDGSPESDSISYV